MGSPLSYGWNSSSARSTHLETNVFSKFITQHCEWAGWVLELSELKTTWSRSISGRCRKFLARIPRRRLEERRALPCYHRPFNPPSLRESPRGSAVDPSRNTPAVCSQGGGGGRGRGGGQIFCFVWIIWRSSQCSVFALQVHKLQAHHPKGQTCSEDTPGRSDGFVKHGRFLQYCWIAAVPSGLSEAFCDITRRLHWLPYEVFIRYGAPCVLLFMSGNFALENRNTTKFLTTSARYGRQSQAAITELLHSPSLYWKPFPDLIHQGYI